MGLHGTSHGVPHTSMANPTLLSRTMECPSSLTFVGRIRTGMDCMVHPIVYHSLAWPWSHPIPLYPRNPVSVSVEEILTKGFALVHPGTLDFCLQQRTFVYKHVRSWYVEFPCQQHIYVHVKLCTMKLSEAPSCSEWRCLEALVNCTKSTQSC